jgi:hypothetical protein
MSQNTLYMYDIYHNGKSVQRSCSVIAKSEVVAKIMCADMFGGDIKDWHIEQYVEAESGAILQTDTYHFE